MKYPHSHIFYTLFQFLNSAGDDAKQLTKQLIEQKVEVGLELSIDLSSL